ncbi:unnamed protein product, partial [Ostreobium quekettii]
MLRRHYIPILALLLALQPAAPLQAPDLDRVASPGWRHPHGRNPRARAPPGRAPRGFEGSRSGDGPGRHLLVESDCPGGPKTFQEIKP